LRYDFEWHPAKARENLRKHRVSFERASTVFLDPAAISILDEAHSEEEERWISLGLDASGSLLVVIHTFEPVDAESARIRIISARRATRREEKDYNEGQA
jgi:hypothetical protein